MLKPSAPAMPGVTDTLDFVKNLWGSMQIPGTGLPGMSGMSGMATPPLSTDDLDKRIADLKAVESWLNLNLTMLRGTIQALEVQRGTLATLKSMGASMAEAMRQSGVSADKMSAMPFAPFFGMPGQNSGPPAKPASPPAAAPAPAPAKPGTPPAGATPSPASAGGGSAQPGADAANPAAMAMPAAVAWWNMLQEQFTQAVAQAMTPPPAPPAPSPASPAPAASASADQGGDAKPAAAPAVPPPELRPARGGDGGNGGNEAGNGKPRASRSKTDKT